MLEAVSAAIRVVLYAAALSAMGLTFARTSLFVREDRSLTVISRVAIFAGLLLSVAAGLTTLTYYLRLGGRPDPALLSALMVSPLGTALALQFLGGLSIAHRPQSFTGLIGALFVLLSFMLIGHAASRGTISSISVGLHVAAAAWWIGGLWILLFASRRWGPTAFSALAIRFSKQAMSVVAIMLAAAIVTAGVLLNFQIDLSADYQRTLIIKAALAVILLIIAGLNKVILTPRLAFHSYAQIWLRRTVALELILLVLILCATAFLTVYTSPSQHH
jgi:putative copper export protein